MGLIIQYDPGQTPLEPDELEGLKIPTITTRGELDEFEQQNIETAMLSMRSKFLTYEKYFTEEFIKEVHKKMYGDVWKWAGQFRNTEKNIGVEKWQIPTALRQLLDDAHYCKINQTFEPKEIAIRFKHRLVSIHCFPNGNGRHSRLMADIFMQNLFKDYPFTWGWKSLSQDNDARQKYLSALRDADKGNIQPLISFALS